MIHTYIYIYICVWYIYIYIWYIYIWYIYIYMIHIYIYIYIWYIHIYISYIIISYISPVSLFFLSAAAAPWWSIPRSPASPRGRASAPPRAASGCRWPTRSPLGRSPPGETGEIHGESHGKWWKWWKWWELLKSIVTYCNSIVSSFQKRNIGTWDALEIWPI